MCDLRCSQYISHVDISRNHGSLPSSLIQDRVRRCPAGRPPAWKAWRFTGGATYLILCEQHPPLTSPFPPSFPSLGRSDADEWIRISTTAWWPRQPAIRAVEESRQTGLWTRGKLARERIMEYDALRSRSTSSSNDSLLPIDTLGAAHIVSGTSSRIACLRQRLYAREQVTVATPRA